MKRMIALTPIFWCCCLVGLCLISADAPAVDHAAANHTAADDPVAADAAVAIPLWTDGAPGSVDRMTEPEKVDSGPGKCNVSNVHHPSITPYLPIKENATGTAIIIAPGGGHRVLCLGHEGDSLAEWFAEHGIAAFVLRYRLAREEGSAYTVDEHAMADTRRAIRMVRQRADEWQIDPDRIGILGFSAGGELAALAAMDSDAGRPDAVDPVERLSSRPDYQVLIYPGSSQRFTAREGMPPAFIALGAKDRPDISLGMAQLYLKYKDAGIPCELHIYANAGHGFGFRPGTTTAAGDWPMRLREWLVDSKLLDE
ncbi:MAG: alpha/beta hydrolase [Planctomycetaceae bacterium]|nr:alpha/beta hydrolase [Planctomycetaceae bacterium]